MRILFITSNRVGDAVLSSGVLAELHRRNPEARITVVAGPASAGLFATYPGLERLIVIEKRKSRGGHWLTLWRQVAATYWHIVVDLRRSAIGWLVPRGKVYRLPAPREDIHRVRHAASTLGMESDPPAPFIPVSDRDREEAERLLGEDRAPVLGIGPTANWQGKIWPADRFVALAEALTGEEGPFPGARIAVFGAPGEEAQAAPILDALGPGRAVDLVGKTSLSVAAASLARCRLYVGNDSGLMHLAAAMGTPTLGLFGPSKESLYAPWGAHCAALRTPQSFEELISAPGYDRHTTPTLMTGITVEMAAKAATELAARTG